MNNERRKQLEILIQKIEVLKYELENILQEEQFCYDNIPENLQYSLHAENSEDAINSMENAIESFDEVIDSINEIM